MISGNLFWWEFQTSDNRDMMIHDKSKYSIEQKISAVKVPPINNINDPLFHHRKEKKNVMISSKHVIKQFYQWINGG